MSTANRFVIAAVVGVLVGTIVFGVVPPILQREAQYYPWGGGRDGLIFRALCTSSGSPNTCGNELLGRIYEIATTLQCATPLISVLAFALTFFLLPKEKKSQQGSTS
jgi:hypothetical protein